MLTSWAESGINDRRTNLAIWDASSWVIALLITTFLRYDGHSISQPVINALVIGVILGLSQVILSWAVQRIRGRRIIGPLDEISVLTFTAAAVTLIGTIMVFAFHPAPIQRSVPFIAGAIALTFKLGGRFNLRAYRQRSLFSQENKRVVIYGAGDSGDQIIRQMLATPSAKFRPVALIDDNPREKILGFMESVLLVRARVWSKLFAGREPPLWLSQLQGSTQINFSTWTGKSTVAIHSP